MAERPKLQHCANCQYWLAPGEWGCCRRHAPIPVMATLDAAWPRTNSEDWCGDWEAEEEIPDDQRF